MEKDDLDREEHRQGESKSSVWPPWNDAEGRNAWKRETSEGERDKRIQALVRLKAMTYEEVMDDRFFLQRQREWEERRVWVWNLKLRNKSQVEATRKENVAEGKTKSSKLDVKKS